MNISKKQSKEKIINLVQRFRDNIKQYENSNYGEGQTIKDFIDKFFKALGWDVDNEEAYPEQQRDVISWSSIKISGRTKYPDYEFRLYGTKVFFVEAKKPSIDIKDDADAAFQLRRYAWNSDMPISILTDFKNFAVYDCRIKPYQKDSSSVARIMLVSFENYSEEFEKIWDIFSKEAVSRGSFDKYVESSKDKKGTSEVSREILKEIEGWRDTLAKNIALKNASLTVSELNYVVQRTIDRILFLRICEDRNIETYEKLKYFAERQNVYQNLLDYFEYAHGKYNSGIFDFKTDKLSKNITIDDKVLHDIIVNLYYPYSPYDFAVLTVEILGSIYEEFLGKTIRLTTSHHAKVEEKPEVRRSGGVYYTPEFVVNYIVKNTVEKLIQDKSPKDIEKIRILDPACGSGTFLVKAYSYLLDYHLNYYLKNTAKYKKEIYQIKENKWFLTTEVRKKILINNIFGVDIDPQAVEITKLSLLLKVLENETKESVNQQLKLFQERALPNLDNNIRCGNSLIDSSYFSQTTLASNQEELAKVNPFDWNDKQKGFGNIKAEGGFDVIIGNPPYIKEYTDREIFEAVKKTNLNCYYQGKMDVWYLFTCKALDLLKDGGLHSFIAPNNWTTSSGASILRNKILSDSKILSFFDFNDFKVFKDADIQTMVFVLEKGKFEHTYFVDYFKIIDKGISKKEIINYFATGKDREKIEGFKAKISPSELIDDTISFNTPEVNNLLEEIKGNGNYKFNENDLSTGIDVHQDFVNDSHLKELKDLSIKKCDGIFNLSQKEYENLKLSKKEKEIVKPFYTTEELFRYYGNPKNRLWVIYSDIQVRKSIENGVDEYPNIKNHLDRFKKIITSDSRPYGIHRAREQRFFEGEKIVSLRKTKLPCFTYTDFPCYVSQTYFVIKSSDINLKYLTGLLNSSLIFFWLNHRGKKQGEQLQIDETPLLKIPIYRPRNENKEEMKMQEDIVDSVDSMIELNKKLQTIKLESEKNLVGMQIKALEEKIDIIIFTLYKINAKEERELIRSLGNK